MFYDACDVKCGRGDYHALRDAIIEAEGRHPEEVAEVADAALQKDSKNNSDFSGNRWK